MLKKALLVSAFFIVSLLLPRLLLAACPTLPVEREARVNRVVDGDTVYLANGERIRLIGVNATEVGHRGSPDQPFAQAAKRRLAELVQGKRVGLSIGRQRQDHYGRLLAHLSVDGVNVEERLVAEGLAYAVAIAPNLRLSECLFAEERRARQAHVGLWKHPRILDAGNLRRGGFHIMKGKVTDVSASRRDWYVELDDNLAVKVSRERVDSRQQKWLQTLRGRRLLVRGWVIDRRADGHRLRSGYKRWLLPVSDLRHLEIAD